MNIDKIIFALAGSIILISVALGHYVNAYWLLLTAFIGLNMLQASFTGFCPAAKVLGKLGFKSGKAFE